MTKEERKQIKREEALEELIIAIEDFLLNVAIVMIAISLGVLFIGEMQLQNLELEENAKKYSTIPREIVFVDPFEGITVNAAELDDIEITEILQQENFSDESKQIEMSGKELNYQPSEKERLWAYRVAYAEARGEGTLGQILVVNVAINNMRRQGYENMIKEFTASGRYSSVEDGAVYVGYGKNKRLVEDQEIPEELKEAVDSAFEKDYSEELLKKEAVSKGITDEKYYKGGACYFYNPETISKKQISLREGIEVKYQHGNHIFYRYW